jgi:hypothetical protein
MRTLLLGILFALPAHAFDQKLVAECIDNDSHVGYRVYQDTSDPSGQTFSAQNTASGETLAPVDLLIDDPGTILWVAGVSVDHLFTLSVNRTDVTDQGTDALLTTDDFEGHIRCQKIAL